MGFELVGQNRTEQNKWLGLTASLVAGRVAGFPQILPDRNILLGVGQEIF